MGKLGNLKVALDKPYYLPGEVVNGTVFVELAAPVDLDSIYVKVKGKEKVEWLEEWEEHVRNDEGEVIGREDKEEEYDYKESFFKKKVQLFSENPIGAGKYAFPFQVQLPTHGKKGGALPGSFEVKEKKGHGWWGARGKVKDLKAKVEYSVKAVVDIDDSKDLEEKKHFVVYSQPPETLAPPSDEKSASVMFLCCVPRGTLHMKASLEKNVYYAGEEAKAILHVTNDSSMEVQAMVEMNTNIYLKADHNRISRKREQNLGRFDVIQPGETKTVEMKFTIGDSLPVTVGKGLVCETVLDIVSEIDWAPDIELHFPVHILQRPVDPEEWLEGLGDVSEYAVVGQCIVEDMPLKPGYE